MSAGGRIAGARRTGSWDATEGGPKGPPSVAWGEGRRAERPLPRGPVLRASRQISTTDGTCPVKPRRSRRICSVRTFMYPVVVPSLQP